MRVAPIIHTRTYSCDFNSEFMVRPDCFLDSDIKWARRNVLGATGAIDSIQGERWIIIDNGKYRIAGVVGFLKNICQKCQLSDEEFEKSKTLFCDDKGRLVYAFIGVAIDKNNSTCMGKITYEYLWKMYLNLIFPVWKRTYQEVITKSFIEETFEACSFSSIGAAEKIGGKKIYEANSITDYEIFEYYLGNRELSNFSYCSNITDYNTVNQSNFSVFTTSQNIITRLKRIATTTPASASSQHTQQSMVTSPNASMSQEYIKNDSFKKKHFLILALCLMIFVIIMLILLLII